MDYFNINHPLESELYTKQIATPQWKHPGRIRPHPLACSVSTIKTVICSWVSQTASEVRVSVSFTENRPLKNVTFAKLPAVIIIIIPLKSTTLFNINLGKLQIHPNSLLGHLIYWFFMMFCRLFFLKMIFTHMQAISVIISSRNLNATSTSINKIVWRISEFLLQEARSCDNAKCNPQRGTFLINTTICNSCSPHFSFTMHSTICI